ncbi:bifunctional adenosylcobinamide kinase/adenosylcobinamide-phosphate guanylyltransferase [Paenibacillus thalictri]|uniref:Adenosylcobinamide kinase n=1 Tax=Paenibacillus thalictri TaxID=2527873 RepID=A0A4Q9DT56_9BACL|nr:bifunctional adenosylcobinamide kinase/adenosylcobinamide-phosphate guanylyltransferase [Paenibacillus thalictri]TBL78284.1 bifunctional adenosylcobinamide kinase/adenosylcobinamide-phosphate guanylyltransferase [Paenibacillus thalictri]
MAVNNKFILVTGGARSGKSSFAERLGERYGERSGKPVVYIATSQIYDREMEDRVEEHRKRRPAGWETVESPYELAEAVKRLYELPVGAVLIDCITLWLSNLLLQNDGSGEERWSKPGTGRQLLAQAEQLAATLKSAPFPVIAVTNEVGHGIVPEYQLGRVYRDLAGRVNQLLAAQADDTYFVVCGIPVNLRQLALQQTGGLDEL